jgi:hypothetical protein
VYHMRNFLLRIKARLNRSTFAYIMMLSFILLSSIGAGLVFIPAGFITAGATCGIFGYLLGRE